MAKKLTTGVFITFEGPEGCGKSTHSRKLFEELKKEGYEVIMTVEPGGTNLGSRIREILLEKEDIHFSGTAELFLFETDRAQHVREVILPAIEAKKLVICDRFNTATFAYQGYGLGVDMKEVQALDQIATGGLEPQLTILLDIDVETGLKRANSNRSADRMEKRSLDFHQRVRDGYLKLAKKSRGRICVVDSSDDINSVYDKVKETVHGFVKRYTRAE